MPKLRIAYIASLLALGVLLVFTVFRPMVLGRAFSEVSNESIIKEDGHWIIEISIMNRENRDTNYTIDWSTGGETYHRKEITIFKGRMITTIHHVYADTLKDGEVRLRVWKEGEASPFEDTVYHVE